MYMRLKRDVTFECVYDFANRFENKQFKKGTIFNGTLYESVKGFYIALPGNDEGYFWVDLQILEPIDFDIIGV